MEGDKDSFFNSGEICVRGKALPEFIYHPQRIIRPLMRKGGRGSNSWEEISYKTAINIIAEKFSRIREKYGAESVVFCKGTARDIGGYLPRLCYGFGSPNYFGLGPGNGNACYRPRAAVSTAMAGGMLVPDLGQFATETDLYRPQKQCIIVWGANPLITNPDGLHGCWLIQARRRGAKLIVIDPRKTALAEKADLFLQIPPGSDGALAFLLLKRLFTSGGEDKEFCVQWVAGADRLKRRLEEYYPEQILTQSCPPAAAQLDQFFDLINRCNSTALIWGVGMDMHPGCVDTIQSVISLLALTGNMEKPGAMLISPEPYGIARRGNSLSKFPNVKRPPIGWEQYPFNAVGNPYAQPDVLLRQLGEGKPYPIKGAFFQGTAVLPSSFAAPAEAARLLGKIDFMVMVDLFMHPGAMALADIILPAAMWPEKDSVYTHYSQLGAINKAVEPPGECKSDAQIILDLGKRLAPEFFPFKTVEDWQDEKLRPAGMTFEQLRGYGALKTEIAYHSQFSGVLRKDGSPGFDTPSGKIELSSSVKQKCRLDPLPHYFDYISQLRAESEIHSRAVRRPLITDVKFNSDDYPFILTTGVRRREYFCSEGRIIPSLRKKRPAPLVDIHPLDAAQYRINQGDAVEIATPFGSCKMQANIASLYHRGVVHCDYGWSFPERYYDSNTDFGLKDGNVNYLFPLEQQGESGFGYPFRCFICKIRKAEV